MSPSAAIWSLMTSNVSKMSGTLPPSLAVVSPCTYSAEDAPPWVSLIVTLGFTVLYKLTAAVKFLNAKGWTTMESVAFSPDGADDATEPAGVGAGAEPEGDAAPPLLLDEQAAATSAVAITAAVVTGLRARNRSGADRAI